MHHSPTKRGVKAQSLDPLPLLNWKPTPQSPASAGGAWLLKRVPGLSPNVADLIASLNGLGGRARE